MEKIYRENRKQLHKKNLISSKRKFRFLAKDQISFNTSR